MSKQVSVTLPAELARRVDAVAEKLPQEIATGRRGIAVRKLIALGLDAEERRR